MFTRELTRGTGLYPDKIARLRQELQDADCVLIGAGAGLSTSAGFVYTGERFQKYFGDFAARYGFTDMYSGGFYPFPSKEEYWAFWSRHIWINRYMDPPKPVYSDLYELVREKDYFVLTTNVDHCFQKAGFDKQRLFYTQGDYGLFQCSTPCGIDTWDNEETIRQMVLAQGFTLEEDNELLLPEDGDLRRAVPTDLLPVCPHCGEPLTMNLRADDKFVEDEGWLAAAHRYSAWLREHEGKRILLLELGVGWNTPGIIKYPFWQRTVENPQATYACLNYSEALCPQEIEARAICLDDDIGRVLQQLK